MPIMHLTLCSLVMFICSVAHWIVLVLVCALPPVNVCVDGKVLSIVLVLVYCLPPLMCVLMAKSLDGAMCVFVMFLKLMQLLTSVKTLVRVASPRAGSSVN